jgi:hypothetical protein
VIPAPVKLSVEDKTRARQAIDSIRVADETIKHGVDIVKMQRGYMFLQFTAMQARDTIREFAKRLRVDVRPFHHWLEVLTDITRSDEPWTGRADAAPARAAWPDAYASLMLLRCKLFAGDFLTLQCAPTNQEPHAQRE